MDTRFFSQKSSSSMDGSASRWKVVILASTLSEVLVAARSFGFFRAFRSAFNFSIPKISANTGSEAAIRFSKNSLSRFWLSEPAS